MRLRSLPEWGVNMSPSSISVLIGVVRGREEAKSSEHCISGGVDRGPLAPAFLLLREIENPVPLAWYERERRGAPSRLTPIV
jgi:hypothetical protein